MLRHPLCHGSSGADSVGSTEAGSDHVVARTSQAARATQCGGALSWGVRSYIPRSRAVPHQWYRAVNGTSSIFYMQLTDRVLLQAVFLFDPVPGNLCWATTINCCNIASQCLDLSMCTNNLINVTAIYPHEPLPDLAFHAPVIPRCVAEPSVV